MTTDRYAGFMNRFVAWLIDALITGTISLIATVAVSVLYGYARYDGEHPTGFMSCLVTGMIRGWFLPLGTATLINWLYFSIFESSKSQGTPGKLAVGIVVANEEAQRISFASATVRFLAKYLSTASLFVGWFMMLRTKRRQCLHDVIAQTVVLERPQ